MTRVLDRPTSRIPVLVAALLLIAALAAPLASAAPAASTWIVPMGEALPAGAKVVSSIPVAGAMVVSSTTPPSVGLSTETPLAWKSTEVEPVTVSEAALHFNAPDSTGAPGVWAGGETGQGSVVALIDTGVAPVAALENSVAGEIDFTGRGGGDAYGHGTFLASLIAGKDSGVAPGAGVLSLKVGDADGGTTLGRVLEALQWLYGPGREGGVRVATLALGVDADSPAAHLLDLAVEQLASQGTFVVTAAGNEGEEQRSGPHGTLTSPATSPGAFVAGSADAQGAASGFSSSGGNRIGAMKPNVLALGESLVGALPEDSVIATENAAGKVDGEWHKGSGTSMSAALTAGVAALVSSARPDLGPAALADTLAAGPNLDAGASLAAAQALPAADSSGGKGKNAASKKGGKSKVADTELQPSSVQWTSVQWTSVQWTSVQWTSVKWTSVKWTGYWGPSGTLATLGSVKWTNLGYQYDDADPRWASVKWTSVKWNSVKWTSVKWTSVKWTSVKWNSVKWTSVKWASVKWASIPVR